MTKQIPLLRFYTKESCHLCDVALEIVQRTANKIDFKLETVDITQSDDLMTKYGVDIPVIEINGNFEFRYKVNEKELLSALEKYSVEHVS